MEEVAAHGRTVLFVSHIMPMIQRLCGRAMFLEKGGGDLGRRSGQCDSLLLELGTQCPGRRVWNTPDQAPGDDVAKLHSVQDFDMNNCNG